MLSHIYCDVLLAVLSANSESVINYMLLIIIMIISKAQIHKMPTVLYKEHDGSGGAGYSTCLKRNKQSKN